ncbi:polysaccharide deacetylase family protein [Rummeliibacillus pycnus]|uniref:polysaccharide deacetylase family protein n=1 Tax=Rummeliibacillus pycnus TaxID=101070 RepID=UPI003D26C885
MKSKYIFVFTICILFVSFFFLIKSTLADKGRKYYEEAGYIVWDIKTKKKIVALTFDDGPHPTYTAEILDLLSKYDAKATFFILGKNAEKSPQVVLRMYEEGHELANHTYTHPLKGSVSQILKEIKKTNETIYSITGFTPTLFRPVEGRYTDGLVNEVVKEGYKVVMWSWHQDTRDWDDPGVNKIVNTVLKGTKPGDVILFHDGGSDRKQTVKALEKILPELQKKGYKFVTISELLKEQEMVKKEIKGKK